jgi:hypothetical protein
VTGVSVSVPSYIVGQAFTFQGTFPVSASAGAAGNGFAAILESTTDNTTWTPVSMFQTTAGGSYSFTYAFASAGTQSYRVYLTGVPWTYITANGVSSPATLLNLLGSPGPGKFNTTDAYYSALSNFKVGTLAQIIQSLATGVGGGFTQLSTGFASQLSTVQANIGTQLNTLTSAVNNLNTQVAGLAKSSDLTNTNNNLTTISYVAYAAIAIALILGLVAIFLARRKPS